MSMTVWLISEDQENNLEEDLSAIFELQEALDELCTTLGVTPIGNFFDDFEFRQNFDLEDFGDMEDFDDFPEFDAPESWHDAGELLVTVRTLCEHLQKQAQDFSAIDTRFSSADVVEECQMLMPVLATAKQRVHLRVLS